MDQVNLVYGMVHRNEAAIRIVVDAVFLDILASVKKEIPLSRKSLHMVLETNISYIFPIQEEKGVVEKLIAGRMDYTLWYGNPKEAETNLVVVEAKQSSALSKGRYQAISYMGKQLPESARICSSTISALIQHARKKAGRAKTPIYGVATDTEDWDFIRMDASGNVRCLVNNYGKQVLTSSGQY